MAMPHPPGSAVRRSGDGHETAHALDDLVDTRTAAVRTALAESGNAGINDPWIDRFDGLVVDAEPVLHSGVEILGDDIGPCSQPHEQSMAAWVLEIERQAPFVAMQVLLVGTTPVAADTP